MSDVRVFPASKKKAFVLLLISLAFVAIGVWMSSENPVMGWFIAAFFGLGILASGFMFLPGKVYLKLDSEGFEMGTGLKKSRTSWKDVDGFDLGAIKGAKMIAVFYNEAYEQQKTLRKVSAAMAGIEGGIPDNYAAPLTEVLAALNEWHARYGRVGA
jgi:hypothetical protein